MGQKDGAETIAYAIKVGRLHPAVPCVLEEAQVIELTGWTPQELDAMEAARVRAYKIVWAARGATPRAERKELSKLG